MNIRLRPRLIVLFLLACLLPLLLTGWVIARWLGESADESARNRASTVLEVKKNRLEQYFSRYRADMETLVNGTQLLYSQQLQRMSTVRDAYGKAVQNQFQEWTHELERLATNEQLARNLASIDWVFREGGEKITGERWPVLSANMTPSLKRFLEKHGFDNLYLVSAQGNVVLGAIADPLLGKNLGRPPLKESGPGRLFADVLTRSTLQGFAPFAPLDNGVSAWIGTPVHKDANPEGRVIGALLVRFSPALLAKMAFPLEEADRNIRLSLVDAGRTPHVETGSGVTASPSGGQGSSPDPSASASTKGVRGQGALKGALSVWAPLSLASSAASQEPLWGVMAEQTISQTLATDGRQEQPFYKRLMEQAGYYDFFLIRPDGEVFFSAARQADFGTNLLNGPYADTNLGRLVRQVLDKRMFALTDFAPYPPSHNEPAAFMAQPLLQDGAVQMVVALQLPLETLTSLMQHRDGLETDGDAYLVGPDKRLRSDSIRDPRNHSVLSSFTGSVAEKGVDSPVVQAALEGQSGQRVSRNWAGQPVFASYAPVPFGHELRWALVTETPMMQGSLPLQRFPLSLWGAAFVALLCCGMMGWMTARSLRRALFACVEPLQQGLDGTASQGESCQRTDEFGRVTREIQGAVERWQQVTGRLRSSAAQAVQIGTELSTLVQQTCANQPQPNALLDLEAGESVTQAMANRIQHHFQQMQRLEQLLERIHVSVGQGRNGLLQSLAVTKEVTDKVAVFVDTAQQTNQLSVRAAFEMAAMGDGKGGKRSGTVVLEIRKLAEQGRIVADEIGALSSSLGDQLESAHTALGSVATVLQESSALTQEMVREDTAQHGHMVSIHAMTQTLKARIEGQSAALQHWAPIAQSLGQQVAMLQKDLAFLNRARSPDGRNATSSVP
ncbi:MAG: methyl-accepting chemotaxis protein [Magnetococcus sp. MYC-9]